MPTKRELVVAVMHLQDIMANPSYETYELSKQAIVRNIGSDLKEDVEFALNNVTNFLDEILNIANEEYI